MKRIYIALVAIMIGFCAHAQQTSDKAVIKTPGVTCDACKTKIEQALFKQYGILTYKVDVKKHIVAVSWLTDRTDIEQIKTMIANAGFDADDVAAEETAHKHLPECCRAETVVTP